MMKRYAPLRRKIESIVWSADNRVPAPDGRMYTLANKYDAPFLVALGVLGKPQEMRVGYVSERNPRPDRVKPFYPVDTERAHYVQKRLDDLATERGKSGVHRRGVADGHVVVAGTIWYIGGVDVDLNDFVPVGQE